MRQTTQGRSLLVSVVAQNYLAAEYLLKLLAEDTTISPLLHDDFVKQRFAASVAPIFVFDHWALGPPLNTFLHQFGRQYPEARYLVLDKEQSDENIVAMLRLGIHGFVRHRDVAECLAVAVHALASGRLWVSPQVLHAYVRLTASSNSHGGRRSAVTTQKETEIVELVKHRLSNKEIAGLLKIRESTVKFHLSNIFAKLQIANRQQLHGKDPSLSGWPEVLSSLKS